MKLTNPDISREFYDRGARRHPIWKSESEFNAIFKNDVDIERLVEEVKEIMTYLDTSGYANTIDERVLTSMREDYKGNKSKIRERQIGLAEQLKECAEEEGIDFDFRIILAGHFYSGFSKPEFNEIEILFPFSNEPYKFSDVTNVLRSDEINKDKDKFFYLYYKRNEGQREISIRKFVGAFTTLVHEANLEKMSKRIK